MKTCSTCKTLKPFNEYRKCKKHRDGYAYSCKQCQKIYDQQWYQKHPTRKHNIRQHNVKTNEKNKEWVFQYLLEHPCMDCGETDVIVLEFDHRHNKDDTISKMMNEGRSLSKLQVEIKKCQVRCANCHRKRHAQDTQSWRFKRLQSIAGDAPVL